MAHGVLFHHAGTIDGSHDVLDLFITLAIGLSLAFLHVWSPYVHPGSYIDSRYWLPFAEGISITYISGWKGGSNDRSTTGPGTGRSVRCISGCTWSACRCTKSCWAT